MSWKTPYIGKVKILASLALAAGLFFAPNAALADCTNPAAPAGKIIYNGDQNVPQVCTGTTWIALGTLNPSAGGSGCSNPLGTEGDIIYNGDVNRPQYCDGDDWREMINIISGSNIGQSCGGGYFAGQIIVSGTAYDLIAQTDDAPSTMTWGPSGVTTGTTSRNDGAANTATLVGLGGSYPAAEYCDGLTDGGQTDWYLPAQNEFSIMSLLEPMLNNFESGGYATSSEDNSTDFRWARRSESNNPLDTGSQSKTNSVPVRCMRRATAGTCSTSLGASGNCPISLPNYAGDKAFDFWQGIWGDGTHIYAPRQDNTLRAYTFDGSSWTIHSGGTLSAQAEAVWGDGTYIYAAIGTSGISGFTYTSGTDTWSAPVTYNTPGEAEDIWGDGTYIYVADAAGGLLALTFNGSAWTLLDTYSTSDEVLGVWGDGTYIYIAEESAGLRALTFNGTSFTDVASVDDGGNYHTVVGDGSYIYAGIYYDDLHAYTFNGTSFTTVGTIDYEVSGKLHYANGYIYGSNQGDISALSFNGTAFNAEGFFPGFYGGASSAWTDGTYVYILGAFDGLMAYPMCN